MKPSLQSRGTFPSNRATHTRSHMLTRSLLVRGLLRGCARLRPAPLTAHKAIACLAR
jgi:hypothetical protein